jgi:hypothetical protein
MNILLTLNSGLGADTGPNFNLTANVGSVIPSTVSKSQLLNGIYVDVDSAATEITITSVGVCTTSLLLYITGQTTSTTSTTSTSTTTTVAPTTTTTFAPVSFTLNYSCLSGLGYVTADLLLGGGGLYQVSNQLYTSYGAAFAGTFIDASQISNSYSATGDGVYYVSVRDKNNTSNFIINSVNVNCATTTTTTAAPTTTSTTSTSTTTTTTIAPIPFTLSYDEFSGGQACANFANNVGKSTYYTANVATLGNGTNIYLDSIFTGFAANGYYSDGTNNWYIDGGGTLLLETICSIEWYTLTKCFGSGTITTKAYVPDTFNVDDRIHTGTAPNQIYYTVTTVHTSDPGGSHITPISDSTTLCPTEVDYTISATCPYPAGTITVNGLSGGLGTYEITTNLYSTSGDALAATVWESITTSKDYTSVSDGTYYVAVRDAGNIENIIVKSVVVACTTTTTTTTQPPTTTTTQPPTTTTTTAGYTIFSLTYSNTSGNTACTDYATPTNRNPYYAGPNATLGTGTILYTTSALTTPVANGYYSNGVNYWNTAASVGNLQNETICTGATTSTTTTDAPTTTTTTTEAPTTTTTTTVLTPCQVSLSPSNIDGATACDNWNNVIDRTVYYALYYPCSAVNSQQLYTDSGLTTLIPNGWYSDGTNYFQVVGGNGTLINSTACTGTTTTTTAASTTTTTTTTAGPTTYQYLGKATPNSADSATACSTYSTIRSYYSLKSTLASIAVNDIIYDSYPSTPTNGGGNWVALTVGGVGDKYSFQIDAYGVVTATGGNCSGGTTTTTTAASTTTTTTTSTTTTSTSTSTSTTTLGTTAAPTVDIYIGNVGSLDIPITGMTINGVAVTWFGSGPDFILSAGDNGSFTSTQIGTYDVVISYGTHTPGQRISFTDSDNVVTCQTLSGSGGTFTITNAAITAGTTISVEGLDGVCP